MRESKRRWSLAVIALLAALWAQGCLDTNYDNGGDDGCPGEVLEYQQTEFCVLIEEGFLTEDCPEAYPEGRDFDGVVVCAEEGEEIPDELRGELEEKGWLGGDQSCQEDADCPLLQSAPFCEDEYTVHRPGSCVQTCQEGMCAPDSCDDGFGVQDCRETGQVCRGGACVDDEPVSCDSDADCPQPTDTIVCEGDILFTYPPCSYSCSDQGTCEVDGCPDGWGERDCAQEGLVCRDGACVDANGPACTQDDDCPIPPVEAPYCDGDVAVSLLAEATCQENACQVDIQEVTQDCTLQGLSCRDGRCAAVEDGCVVDEQCPQPIPYVACEGNVAVNIFAYGYCDQDSLTCQIDGEESRINCSQQGLVCRDGECVDSDGSCEADSDCEIPPAEPYCESDDIAVVAPAQCFGSCEMGRCEAICQDGFGIEDCAAQGEVCRGGACVDPDSAECAMDSDCPVPPVAPPHCEDAVAVQIDVEISCEQGQCIYNGGERREDCNAQGLICLDGYCTEDPGAHDCQSDDQCPQPRPPAPVCEGDVVVATLINGYCSDAGQCRVDTSQMRTDCAAQGQRCQEGECVGTLEPMCRGDLDCPVPDVAPPHCEGTEVVSLFPNIYCDQNTNQCVFESEESRIDCAANGQLCQDGLCVDAGPNACRSDMDCPVPLPPLPTCDGDVMVSLFPNIYCDEDTNQCIFESNESRTDCAETGQVCRDGFCADP